MSAMTEFTFIEDPGHGWLMVPKDVARQVGYKPTGYDYETEDHWYFEEDCSALAFIAAYKTHHPDRQFTVTVKYEEDFRQRARRLDG